MHVIAPRQTKSRKPGRGFRLERSTWTKWS